jgi:hypothetical protein
VTSEANEPISDAHEGRQADTAFSNGVAANGPVLLHVSDVRSHGTFACFHLGGEVNIGHSSVLSKLGEDGSVNFCDAGHDQRSANPYFKPFPSIFIQIKHTNDEKYQYYAVNRKNPRCTKRKACVHDRTLGEPRLIQGAALLRVN